jgi:hypothetical protein
MKTRDLVKVVLTSEIGMIIEVLHSEEQGYVSGYMVRMPDYRVIKFAHFEVTPRN